MFTDPYPRYAELRQTAKVSRVKVRWLIRGTGYMLTRYADVMTLYGDERFSSNALEQSGNAKLAWLFPETFRVLTESMVFKDNPEHKRLRALVQSAFTPKLIKTMTEQIAGITDDLIDRLAEKTDVDLIEDFAVQLPLSVIAAILGADASDRDAFHKWCSKLLRTSGGGPVSIARSLPASHNLLRLFRHLGDEARHHPNDGLISNLVQANDNGDRLSDREVFSMMFLLLLAGHDTTSNLIGNGMLALLNNPDQLARLRAEPGLIDSAVEELLRYASPVAFGVTRYALEEVEIAGVCIPKGGQVIGNIISANRDESVFENAARLDLGRNPNKHLAFAFGTHYCLGHQLARIEGKLAIGELIQRFDNLELSVAQSQLRYKPTAPLRGLTSLPMRVS
jgi:cytochrome P450